MSASEPFTLFHKFPPELKLDILSFCTRNDLVCLSLTGPDMRNLVAPLIPSKPNLTWADQLGPTPDVPSECRDPYHNNIPRRPDCDGPREREVVYSPISHRFRRHEYSGKICYRCRNYPSAHPVCNVSYCKKHCACISCPLFMRLRGWMGDRKYCAECNQFTTRIKRNNGRLQALTGGKRCGKHQTTIGVAAKDYLTEIGGGENGGRMGLTTRRTSPKTPEDEMQESFKRVIYSRRDLFNSL
ncbi:hypothetical protein LB503_006066 [Fusarium chuoi]|nr:hypothetical protein LB503_006066 [Fusarium chuoi]